MNKDKKSDRLWMKSRTKRASNLFEGRGKILFEFFRDVVASRPLEWPAGFKECHCKVMAVLREE